MSSSDDDHVSVVGREEEIKFNKHVPDTPK